MSRLILKLIPLGAVLSISVSVAGAGDCEPQWVPTFGETPGVDAVIETMAVFDDGSGDGPALYVGGDFIRAGGFAANRLAKWDGSRWSPVGGGINGTVRALAVFDDGSGDGPALYVGGTFSAVGGPDNTMPVNCLARWDGSSWSIVGDGFASGFVWSLAVHDDGTGDGPALIVGGFFTHVNGLAGEPGTVEANRIAKWDGKQWSAMGGGMTGGAGGQVRALQVFDDGLGDGPVLYAAGSFLEADGNVVNRIAKWDGESWTAVGDGFNTHVWDLAVFDDGEGPALYAGGEFISSGSTTVNRVARWDPITETWSALDGGVNNVVRSLLVFDDGDGEALHVAGNFTTAGGEAVNRLAKWDGDSWSASPPNGMNNVITSLALYDADDGNGLGLYAGGNFLGFGGGLICDRIARWDVAFGGWTPLGTSVTGAVSSFGVFDDGTGPALHVGGGFVSAAGTPLFRTGKWNAASGTWSPLGSGINNTDVYDFAVFDDGTGPALYAVGNFTTAGGLTVNRIAKWDGKEWSALAGGGLGGIARALAVFDDGTGPALYVGGQFTATSGGLTVNRIAKWDGKEWSALGAGMNQTVSNLIVFDDGSGGGPALYASGGFTMADGLTVNRIAKWDGTSWSGLGSPVPGVPALVTSLAVYDDGSGESLKGGSGEALYISFDGTTTSNGVVVNRIARWDGKNWSPLGDGLNHTAQAMTAFDDGSGSGTLLYVGGAFTAAGGQPIEYLARWDGANWSPVGTWANGLVSALAVFDDGLEGGPSLFIGGSFINSPSGDGRLAKWAGCADVVPCGFADLNCDGVVNVQDLLILLGAWGSCDKTEDCPADLNDDGAVNVQDLLVLLANWG